MFSAWIWSQMPIGRKTSTQMEKGKVLLHALIVNTQPVNLFYLISARAKTTKIVSFSIKSKQ